MKRIGTSRLRSMVLATDPRALEFGFGPVGHLEWYVFNRDTKECLGRGKTERGAWGKAWRRLCARAEGRQG